MAIISTLIGGLVGFTAFLLSVFAFDAPLIEALGAYVVAGLGTAISCLIGGTFARNPRGLVHSTT